MTLGDVEPVAPEYIRHHWPADPTQLPVIRRFLRSWLRGFDLSTERADNLLLALCEAIGNAIRHAYDSETPGDVVLVAWTERGALNVEIHDSGSWQGGSSPTSGLGIELMHSFVDSVAIAYSRHGTRVRFRQKLSSRPSG